MILKPIKQSLRRLDSECGHGRVRVRRGNAYPGSVCASASATALVTNISSLRRLYEWSISLRNCCSPRHSSQGLEAFDGIPMKSSGVEFDLRLLRLPRVIEKTGLSRSSLYEKIACGHFPKPVRLGTDARSVAWVECEVDEWIQDAIHRRDALLSGARKVRS